MNAGSLDDGLHFREAVEGEQHDRSSRKTPRDLLGYFQIASRRAMTQILHQDVRLELH